MNNRSHVAAASALLLLAGCTDDGPAAVSSGASGPAAAAPPSATTAPSQAEPGQAEPSQAPDPPASSPGTDHRVAEFLGFTAPKPAVWLWHPPENRMRAANYVVPAASGGEQAHVVIFAGIGGGKDANITRWRSQFRDTEHSAVDAHLTELEADGIPITLVELQGERMRMGEGWYTPNQLLLAAIVQAPEGDVHILFQGQYETVHANREAFKTFITGLQRQRDG